jgi:hypothetical protein
MVCCDLKQLGGFPWNYGVLGFFQQYFSYIVVEFYW